jgi:serine/threonine-protein kinase PknK
VPLVRPVRAGDGLLLLVLWRAFTGWCRARRGRGPPAPPLPPPDTVGPELPGYTVLERLGAGGSAVVYRARQESLDREVAVKLIRQEVDDAAVWRRFEREARIVATLSGHPNVLTVYDVGRTVRGEPFLVTELLDRGSLGDILAERGGVDGDSVADVGRAVAAALSTAHEQGILHRDVKPGNVLVDSHRRIKLGDFGVARLMAGHTQTTTASVAFTPEHVAPEVLRGEPEGPASDVYGLGSTLLTALLGRSPFQRRPDERIEAMMWRKLNDPPPTAPPWTPAVLAGLVSACLAPDPADRPSLVEVQRRLTSAPGTSPSAPGPSPTVRLPSAATVAGAPPSGSEPTLPLSGGTAGPPAGPRASQTEPAGARAGRRAGGWGAVAAVAVVAVLAAGALYLGITADDEEAAVPEVTVTSVDDAVDEAPPADPPAGIEPPPEPAPAAPEPEEPAPATTEPAAPPTTAAPEPSPPAAAAIAGPVTEEEAVAFVRGYYDLIEAGRHAEAWELLSPEFRTARSLNFGRYVSYWRTTSLELGEVRLTGAQDGAAQVRFEGRYVTGGRVVDEANELTLVRSDDGLIITDQRIVR